MSMFMTYTPFIVNRDFIDFVLKYNNNDNCTPKRLGWDWNSTQYIVRKRKP